MADKTGKAASIPLLIGALGSALSADLTVKLTAGQEVPALTTSATGTGTIVIKSDKSVSGSITTVGIEGTMTHIHLASPENQWSADHCPRQDFSKPLVGPRRFSAHG